MLHFIISGDIVINPGLTCLMAKKSFSLCHVNIIGIKQSSKLNDISLFYNITCHVNQPSRITANAQNYLDQISSSIPNYVVSVAVIALILTTQSHHGGHYILFNFKNLSYYRHVSDYKNGDCKGF